MNQNQLSNAFNDLCSELDHKKKKSTSIPSFDELVEQLSILFRQQTLSCPDWLVGLHYWIQPFLFIYSACQHSVCRHSGVHCTCLAMFRPRVGARSQRSLCKIRPESWGEFLGLPACLFVCSQSSSCLTLGHEQWRMLKITFKMLSRMFACGLPGRMHDLVNVQLHACHSTWLLINEFAWKLI